MFISKPAFGPLLVAVLIQATGFASAAALSKRAGRTSPPSGCLVVRSSAQSGEYSSLSTAVDAITSSGGCIFIYPGTYTDYVDVRYKGPLTIYGYTTDTGTYKSNTVTITHNLGSADAGNLDASSTINVANDDFNLYNINVENTYGTAGQAVALTGNGERLGFYGCQFKSYQDTLYAKAGYQYYSNCYIEGAVDYIFGDASAWFGECVIVSSGPGYVTANSRTYEDDTAWYVIDHSTVKSTSGVDLTGKVYLGRPWRVLARVMYQYSELTDVVRPEGWTTMAEGATPIFMEYENTGDGSSTSDRLYLTQSSQSVSKGTLWPEGYDWIDRSY